MKSEVSLCHRVSLPACWVVFVFGFASVLCGVGCVTCGRDPIGYAYGPSAYDLRIGDCVILSENVRGKCRGDDGPESGFLRVIFACSNAGGTFNASS